MKLVVLGSDDRILAEGSRAGARIRRYAALVEELYIVVSSRRDHPFVREGNLHIRTAPGRSWAVRWIRLLRTGASICRDARPDLISSQDPGEHGLAGCLLSSRYQIPLQVQVHTDIFSPFYAKASWRERGRAELAAFVLPRASGIRAVSRRVADSIHRRLGVPDSKIAVLPIYTDLEESRAARRQAATDERFRSFGFRMVAAGRFIEREKYFGLLLDLMPELRRTLPRPVLVLVGDGPDKPLYERKIRALGLDDCVLLEPWREDLPSFLKSFDVLVLPSNYEGFPRICLEATAAGLPIVMTDVGSAGELFVNEVNAMVVPVGDAPSLAASIQRLAADGEARRKLVRSAQEAVARFSFSSVADYEEAYVEALEMCLMR